MNRRRTALALLYVTATLVLIGGFYDLLVPAPPPHQLEFLGLSREALDARTAALLRGLIRALGAALVGVGLAALALIRWGISRGQEWAAGTLLLLVGVPEGMNAVQMYRVGSPWWAPLAFIALLVVGLVLLHVPTSVLRSRGTA